MNLLRLAAGELRDIMRAATSTHLHLRERLTVILGATLLLDLLASIAVYFLERNSEGTKITTFGDSVFWVSTQLTTVSSQLPNPLTTGGRVLGVFLQLWAVLFVASLAGSFAAFFHRRGHERDAAAHESGADSSDAGSAASA